MPKHCKLIKGPFENLYEFYVDSQFSGFGESKYEDLFAMALRKYDILCIGIYRYLELNTDSSTDRYVITNPNNDFQLHSTDKIFAFVPYNF